MDTKTARIRALNDQLRQHLTGGMAVITPGVAALGPKLSVGQFPKHRRETLSRRFEPRR